MRPSRQDSGSGPYRDESPCARVQFEARNDAVRSRRADGGGEGLKRRITQRATVSIRLACRKTNYSTLSDFDLSPKAGHMNCGRAKNRHIALPRILPRFCTVWTDNGDRATNATCLCPSAALCYAALSLREHLLQPSKYNFSVAGDSCPSRLISLPTSIVRS
jgi:hypothetical protein